MRRVCSVECGRSAVDMVTVLRKLFPDNSHDFNGFGEENRWERTGVRTVTRRVRSGKGRSGGGGSSSSNGGGGGSSEVIWR